MYLSLEHVGFPDTPSLCSTIYASSTVVFEAIERHCEVYNTALHFANEIDIVMTILTHSHHVIHRVIHSL
jgi:hypothetical protein